MARAAETLHTPMLIKPESGRRFAFAGLEALFKVDGRVTQNRFAVAYFPEIPPHLLAAPLHRHHKEDEYSFVLEGTLGTLIDDQVLTATSGTWVVKPRGHWHTFFNPADVPCRTIEIVSPAAFQQYFDEVAALGGRMDRLPQLNAKYSIDMDMASVPALCSRFSLQFPADVTAL